jgi:hypothetical protein
MYFGSRLIKYIRWSWKKTMRISWSIGATTYCYLKCIVYDKLLNFRQSFWITLYKHNGDGNLKTPSGLVQPHTLALQGDRATTSGQTSSVSLQVPAVLPAESEGRHDVSIRTTVLFAKAWVFGNHEFVNASSVKCYSQIAHQLMGFVLLQVCSLLKTTRTIIRWSYTRCHWSVSRPVYPLVKFWVPRTAVGINRLIYQQLNVHYLMLFWSSANVSRCVSAGS